MSIEFSFKVYQIIFGKYFAGNRSHQGSGYYQLLITDSLLTMANVLEFPGQDNRTKRMKSMPTQYSRGQIKKEQCDEAGVS